MDHVPLFLYYSSRVVVLAVDAEVFALLLDTYMPGVVFLFQHGVSPPSVSAIRYHWFPIRSVLVPLASLGTFSLETLVIGLASINRLRSMAGKVTAFDSCCYCQLRVNVLRCLYRCLQSS